MIRQILFKWTIVISAMRFYSRERNQAQLQPRKVGTDSSGAGLGVQWMNITKSKHQARILAKVTCHKTERVCLPILAEANTKH